MALSKFLSSALGKATAVAPYAKSAYDVYQLFKRPSVPGAQRAQEAALGQQQQLSAALADPNNPLYRQIQQQEEQQRRTAFTERVQDLIRENRRLSAMGRTPLFDPERADENIYRAVQKGYMDAESASRTAALDRIRTALSGQATTASTAQQLATQQQEAIDRQQRGRALGAQTMLDLLQQLNKRAQESQKPQMLNLQSSFQRVR